MIRLEKLKVTLLGIVVLVLIGLTLDYLYHMIDHYNVNHPYKIVCIEGHKYVQITNSFQGFMSPVFGDDDKPARCEVASNE